MTHENVFENIFSRVLFFSCLNCISVESRLASQMPGSGKGNETGIDKCVLWHSFRGGGGAHFVLFGPCFPPPMHFLLLL